MYLYIFCDSVTGEMQQPILAHNDDEAKRIARMAFSKVPHQILRDLYIARVTCYDDNPEPKFTLSALYCGFDFISESDDEND